MLRPTAVVNAATVVVILLLLLDVPSQVVAKGSSNVRGARSKDDENNSNCLKGRCSTNPRRKLRVKSFNWFLFEELLGGPPKLPTQSPTNEPTLSVAPTAKHSFVPSNDPSSSPTMMPTKKPTSQPSTNPTIEPSESSFESPTKQPTPEPSRNPSTEPSGSPSKRPTKQPTAQPSANPTGVPSESPSERPTKQPTPEPSTNPTTAASDSPSERPTQHSMPEPSTNPTTKPSESPSRSHTNIPTTPLSIIPTSRPSLELTGGPTNSPTTVLSKSPSSQPSQKKTSSPSRRPSGYPTEIPTFAPVQNSEMPTAHPRAPPFPNAYPNIDSSPPPSTVLPTASPTKRESPSWSPAAPPGPTPPPSLPPTTNAPSPSPTKTFFRCLGSQLSPNERLHINEYICSPDGRYYFGLDKDGDLGMWEDGLTKVWSAVTCCTGVNVAFTMQDDGNAVVRSSSGSLWSSKTHDNPGAYITVENNGVAYILKELPSSSPPTLLWELDYCGFIVRPLPKPGPSPPGLVPVDASTLSLKIMAGYQGWFGTPCDGGYNKWKHWTGGRTPAPGRLGFDMWPDLREFDDDELCPTEFEYPDGSTAGLFSSATAKTVERHTKWMYDYGIDGVFVQRFVNELRNDRCIRDQIIGNIRSGSERYGRVFANMYDISGADANTVYVDIMQDWMHMVDVERITQSDRYLHHKGRPLVSIWGFGVYSRPGTPEGVAELLYWFHHGAEEKYRATVLGGVPTGWRTLSRDSKTDPAWASVYRSFDIISPWTVGRYRDNAGADNFRNGYIAPDVAECKRFEIDYMPVVFPGFSVTNYKPTKPFNEIPRNGGTFFWNQIHNALDAGSSQVYVAMFDEVDEGTAIFKVAETFERTPINESFVTLDVDGYLVPSDWYLWLTGNATDWLRRDGSVPSTMPPLPPSSASSMLP